MFKIPLPFRTKAPPATPRVYDALMIKRKNRFLALFLYPEGKMLAVASFAGRPTPIFSNQDAFKFLTIFSCINRFDIHTIHVGIGIFSRFQPYSQSMARFKAVDLHGRKHCIDIRYDRARFLIIDFFPAKVNYTLSAVTGSVIDCRRHWSNRVTFTPLHAENEPLGNRP